MANNNRNPIIRWFITFPKTEMEREDFINQLPPCSYYCVAREEHKDGNHHLHTVAILKKGLNKHGMLHYLRTKFPNDYMRIDAEPIRDLNNSIDYCRKEDPECIVYGSTSSNKIKAKIDLLIEQKNNNEKWEERIKKFYEEKELVHEQLIRDNDYFQWNKKVEEWAGFEFDSCDITEDHSRFVESGMDAKTWFCRNYPNFARTFKASSMS